MLAEYFPKLNAFFRSNTYLALTVSLAVCANLFSLELPVYYLYLGFILLVVLFGRDLSGVIPIVPGCYISVSRTNNPAESTNGAFYQSDFQVQFIFVLSAIAALVLARLVSILMHRGKRPAPALTSGFFALGLAYVLGGVLSNSYSGKTALFGLVQIASLAACYLLFCYTVDSLDKGYFARLFTALGVGVLAELAGMYAGIGSFGRGALVTGWGMYNNVGCVLAMCLPAPLYFAAVKKRGWRYTLLGVIFALGVLFTQSRGAILFGGVVFLAAVVVVIIKSKERLSHLLVLGGAALAALVFLLVWREKFSELFSAMLDQGLKSNGRLEIYEAGLRQFFSAPFFGRGFYECSAFRWGALSSDAFLPPRWHNTYIQLLASGGVFAFGCYLLHRIETLFLLFYHPSLEKTFIALSIAALLLTSLVDCHFFNFGPALLYSILLFCAENNCPATSRKFFS